MTRLEIKTLILSWLDDSNSSYFIDSNLNVWVNQAQKQIQGLLLQAGQNWYEIPVETLTVSGQSDYLLPSDFVTEQRLELVVSGSGLNEERRPIREITTNQQDWVSIQTGRPTLYSIKKDRVTLFPTPDAQYTLRLYYSPLVADLGSDSDVPNVPGQFHEYVAVLGAYNGFIKDDRAPQNLVLKKNELELLLKQMAAKRMEDATRQVVQANDYDTGVGY